MEYLNCCITTMKAYCREGGCHGRWTYRLDIDKTVSSQWYILQLDGLNI